MCKVLSLLHTDVIGSLVCDTLPGGCTENAVFIVDLQGLASPKDLTVDDLGSWGKPSGIKTYANIHDNNVNITTQ